MKHKAKHIIILFTIIVLSCEKDLEIKINSNEIKQVVNGKIRENENIIIYLSKSKMFNDNSSVEFISNAVVQLYEDDIFVENMPFVIENSLNGLGYYTSTITAQENKKYKIVSTTPNLKTIEATELLLPKPVITNQILLQYPDSNDIYVKAKLQLTLKDSLGIKNYYFLNLYERIKYFTAINGNDTTFDYHFYGSEYSVAELSKKNTNFNRIYFDDSKFNGTIKTLNISFNGIVFTQSNIVEHLVFVEISSIGEGFYNYFLSEQENRSGVGNINKEPISLLSNIKNGYGHFSSANTLFLSYKIK